MARLISSSTPLVAFLNSRMERARPRAKSGRLFPPKSSNTSTKMSSSSGPPMSPMRASTEEFMDETAMRVDRGMCARLG